MSNGGTKKFNIVKAASWYRVGNILIRGVSFFVLPIFTRLMSTYEYGVYSVYMSYLSIFETIILLGMSATITIARYAKELDYEAYISTAITIPIIFSALSAAILNIYLRFGGNLLSMDAVLWNCLLISAGCGAVNGIIGAKLIIEGRYHLYMGYSALYLFSNIGCSLILCYTFFQYQNTHLARVFGSTAAAVISMLFLLVTTRTWFGIQKECLRYAFAWGIPLLFHTLATVILTQSDRILIRYMDSYSAAGIYTIATTIATVPAVLQSSLAHAWTPWFYEKLDKGKYERICWLNDRYIVGYGGIIAIFMLISPELVRLFTEKSYWGSIYSLLPLAISVFGEMIYSLSASVEYYYKKTTYMMVGTIITVVINIILDIAFIFLIGYTGAAYATALSKMTLFLMHYRFSKKLDKNNMFSGKVVFISIMALAVLNVMVLLTLDQFIVRYIFLLSIMIPVGWYMFKNKKLLIQKLKED